jgi:hypothetical protein
LSDNQTFVHRLINSKRVVIRAQSTEPSPAADRSRIAGGVKDKGFLSRKLSGGPGGAAARPTAEAYRYSAMELTSIKDLMTRRRKLVKLLEPLPPSPIWPEDLQAECHETIRREIADIDQQIAERTGSRPPIEAE